MQGSTCNRYRRPGVLISTIMERLDADFYLNSLTPEYRTALLQQIAPEENLLWVSRPNPVAFARANLSNWLFFNAFAAACITIVVQSFYHLSQQKAGNSTLFAIFLAVLFPGVIATWFIIVAAAERLVYAVTDQRVLSLEYDTKGRHEVGFALIDLDALTCVERSDATGDLSFVDWKAIRHEAWNNFITLPSLTDFYGIGNVRYVEQLLRETFPKKEMGSVYLASIRKPDVPGYPQDGNKQQ